MQQHFTSSLSKSFGRFASQKHTKKFQNFINRSYVAMMGLDMGDFNAPESYPTLNALFTRHLKVPRNFSADPSLMISPCDSLVTETGSIQEERALQIKGMSYSVDAFLGDDISSENKARIHGGDFINFYLSPRDYHRYHIPLDMQVTKAIHIPGKLYPVNIPTLKRKIDLFIENERVVLECFTTQGKLFYLVLVGALNVGKMEVGFEPRIQTNTALGGEMYTYENLHLKKGDDFGCFQMGSTIIFLSEKGMMESDVTVGMSVRFGQTIGRIF
ncbi:MAG: phosphatidylserine decarboxylase [Sulfuricurvum sp.]